jgi:cysteine desulfurase/selenocysteine lyase
MTSAARARTPRLDVARVRRDFPILARRIFEHRLVYLDSAASSQKPRQVLDALSDYYTRHHANVHRGVHTLSTEATELYEAARAKVARFIGAASPRECVFVRGTTEAINLVSQAWARPRLSPGDEVLVSEMEHHSNLVPWQIVCRQTGAKLVVAPFDDAGDLAVDEFRARLSARTRVVALTHVSNVLGTVNPVVELAQLARARGALVVLDGAQAVPHMPVDVRELGCDFYAFSGHKMYGPTGIGVLWGRAERLAETEPWQGGGSMIRSVTFEETTFADPPERFEAGTPHIAGAVGLGAAVEYLEGLGMEAVAAHERELLAYAVDKLDAVPGLRLIGRPRRRAGCISFTTGDVHPHDLGTFLDREGIAVRVGHHCAQPIMAHYGVPATTRASLGVHNDFDDIDALASGIRRVLEFFA